MAQPGRSASHDHRERNGLFRLSRIPAALALMVIVAASIFAEVQNHGVHTTRKQAEVLNDLSLIRARLEGAINGNIQLIRGLVATIAIDPDMTLEHYASLSRQLMDANSQITNIAAAPDLVVTMTYPLEGNEAVIGLDYTASPEQIESALRARDSGEMVLAGPVDLVQGGSGFIARFPVFIPREGHEDHFWGIVSAVIDADRLYRDSGLLDEELDIEVAIAGRDGLGERGPQFFGNDIVASSDPVVAEVTLPSGSWVMKAIPAGGWAQAPDNIWQLRIWILLAASLIMIPTMLSGRLIDERQRHIRQLKDRELQLEKVSRRLGLALETSQVGVWELDIENLHIDLDRFKHINDTLGHAAGDAMLVHAARVLTSTVRDGDFVARVGGDEFVVVCRRPIESPDLGSSQLSKLAERIIARMQEPILFEGHECRCGVSIGIASDTDSIADPLRLLVNADIALYRAKGQGRNRYQFFNDALQGEIIRTKRIADEILTGVEKKQFVAWFQPQVDANTLEIVGVEALARWNHPVEGLLPPGAFLKIADELNVVGTIDRMIMEQAMAQMDKWEAEGIHVPKVSVNVSARRLNDEGLIEGLRKLHVQPGRLSFELVESIFLDEHDDIISWNVDRIKELGIEIEIDDFGTGHASIVSLLKLKPKRLKIDRQFILPIVRSAAQRQLVGSIVEIGKSLGIEVLAEGVETMEHARILRKLGCQSLQGYAFARPMAAEDFAEFYRGRRWRKAS
jgi:diguanylate cyclase (GGDEF)-like protein